MHRVGVSYRPSMSVWIDSGSPAIDFLEIIGQVFVRAEMANRLAMLARTCPLAVRSTILSLGTPGPMREDMLQPLARLAADIEPLWVSEAIGFCRTGEAELNRYFPVFPNEASIATIADHAKEVSDRCGCPVLLETFASPLRFDGPMPETDFLNRVCARSGCGLLLDVASLFVNSRNHGFDPEDWLMQLDPGRIAQFHVSGYRRKGGRLEDLHDAAVQTEIWDLARLVVSRAPSAGGIIEHDTGIPAADALEDEIAILRNLAGSG